MLFLVGVLVWLCLEYLGRYRGAIQLPHAFRYLSKKVMSSGEKFGVLLLRIGILTSIGSLAVLAGRPFKAVTLTQEQYGLDVQVCFDTSRSMWQETDVFPNRLEAAKELVMRFSKEIPQDRMGLILFQRTPLLLSPLTSDKEYVRQKLQKVDSEYTLGVLDAGTGIGECLAFAVDKFTGEKGRTKVLLLITDGASNIGLDPFVGAEYVLAQNIKIIPVFVANSSSMLAGSDTEMGYEIVQKIAEMSQTQAYLIEDDVSSTQIGAKLAELPKGIVRSEPLQYTVDTPELFLTIATMSLMLSLGTQFTLSWYEQRT